MKRTLLTVAALALLADGPTLVRAGDMGNMPGMEMPGMKDQAGQTNAPTVKPYPLNYCIVSGDKLGGDMGKPVTLTYKGQEMIFCCKDCPKDFKKNPEKYMKKLAEAEAKIQK